MLYMGFIQAIKSNSQGFEVSTIPYGVFAANEYEAKGKLMEHCYTTFPSSQGYSNHAVGCDELTEEVLQRGLREVPEKTKEFPQG